MKYKKNNYCLCVRLFFGSGFTSAADERQGQ